MLSNRLTLHYNNCVNEFEKDIEKMFRKDMKQLGKVCAFADHGWFWLSYEFIPYNYIITIENEMSLFDIRIEDKEEASTPLGRIEKYDSKLNEKNIDEAVCLLKKVLYKNDFDFYIHRDDKVYIKNKQGIKRLKGKAFYDRFYNN